jgi:hypothetical protein
MVLGLKKGIRLGTYLRQPAFNQKVQPRRGEKRLLGVINKGTDKNKKTRQRHLKWSFRLCF